MKKLQGIASYVGTPSEVLNYLAGRLGRQYVKARLIAEDVEPGSSVPLSWQKNGKFNPDRFIDWLTLR